MDPYYLAYQGRNVVCVVLCDNSDDNLAFENVGPLVGNVSEENVRRTRPYLGSLVPVQFTALHQHSTRDPIYWFLPNSSRLETHVDSGHV